MLARRIGEYKNILNVENVANTDHAREGKHRLAGQMRAMRQALDGENSLVSTNQTDIDVPYNITPSSK